MVEQCQHLCVYCGDPLEPRAPKASKKAAEDDKEDGE